MYLLGYDLGSSSIKATILDGHTGVVIASAISPAREMEILAPKPGWAEQSPQLWWDHVITATAKLKSKALIEFADIAAIGISYQMHGLVIIDKNRNPLRPAIIWCDSRAVQIGQKAYDAIGPETCLRRLLNSPGNFTASKLKWVMDNEPDIFDRIYKVMLPGDYLAMLLTGQINTTTSGLSEAILWDYQQQDIASFVLDYYGIPADIIPDRVPTFSTQGNLTTKAAQQLSLKPGIPIAYRAGDQPNNALSLNVLEPGEIAATAGTSGVVCGIGDKPNYDPQSRVNTFVHVNHSPEAPRYSVLLCVNGAGILNSWLKHNVMPGDQDYPQMNEAADRVPIGSDGLVVFPYGNGAERTLGNRDVGASIHNLNFNIHTRAHLLRAAQEGIVFALNYGLEIMQNMSLRIDTVRAGHGNMFLSPLFANAFATVLGAQVELYDTDGSAGAARGAGYGAGFYKSLEEAFVGLEAIETIEPSSSMAAAYQEAYHHWLGAMQNFDIKR